MNEVKESLVVRLRKRAEIRRGIPRAERDRIADVLEEAATAIDDAQADRDEAPKAFRDVSGKYTKLYSDRFKKGVVPREPECIRVKRSLVELHGLGGSDAEMIRYIDALRAAAEGKK